MLKESLLFGLVMPLLFKPRMPVADSDPGEPPPMPALPGLDPQPAATVAAGLATDDIPWPELPHMRTPKAAVREFLDEMIEEFGGGTIPFHHVAWSYEDARKGRQRHFDETGGCAGYAPRPWPPLKGKTLSRLLCALGCVRVKQVTRNAAGRRLTYIAIPAPAEVGAEEDFAAPLALAA